jgi:hypothetical protein
MSGESGLACENPDYLDIETALEYIALPSSTFINTELRKFQPWFTIAIPTGLPRTVRASL